MDLSSPALLHAPVAQMPLAYGQLVDWSRDRQEDLFVVPSECLFVRVAAVPDGPKQNSNRSRAMLSRMISRTVGTPVNISRDPTPEPEATPVPLSPITVTVAVEIPSSSERERRRIRSNLFARY
jgi:hypothetical protein